MNEMLFELAKQTPALGVLVLLVLFFLRHLKQRDEKFLAEFREIHNECHDHHASSTETIKENTQTMGRVLHALDNRRTASG